MLWLHASSFDHKLQYSRQIAFPMYTEGVERQSHCNEINILSACESHAVFRSAWQHHYKSFYCMGRNTTIAVISVFSRCQQGSTRDKIIDCSNVQVADLWNFAVFVVLTKQMTSK